MIRFAIVCFWFASLSATAFGDKKYPVNEIPDTLLKGVDVVFREDYMTYTIHSRDRATKYVRMAVTILNEKGKHYARNVVAYDKLSKITMFKGASYQSDGTLIKKLKASEIYDQSEYDGMTLYGDNRLKSASLSYGSYPYTVEFEYEVEYKFLFFTPDFVIIPDERISVQNSFFQMIFPSELAPKYKVMNIDALPNKGTDKDLQTLTWTFKDLLPIKFDPMGPPSDELIPQIMTSPTLFDFDGHQGSAKTWDEFGQWILSLNKNRNVLPPETIQKLKDLTANLKTEEEKVKAVYEYMQSKTRYVLISLGIGGFQPFEASLVDKVGYGDCKALSNYMVSMLEAIGIKSNYVLVLSGKVAIKLKEDFPGSQFNHVIVMVPNQQDTIWLECTNQTIPFGYMGTHTGNRKALAITENGAKVVSTPQYNADVNKQLRTAQVVVAGDGNAKATIRTTYSGLKYEDQGLFFYLEDRFDDQKKWVEENTNIPSFNINSFKMENRKARIPSAVVTLDLQLNRYASVNGKRIFLTPNLMTKNSYIPQKVENRKTDVVINSGFVHIDSIHYIIPENLYAETLPELKNFKSTFGEYEAQFKLDQGKLLYIRKFKLNEGTYPAKTYDEFIEFSKNINKADNVKVVFVNKT
jgi:Domain of Unknown Function with PDB structure (DUF3857)/Transglutaminase-like superfamily